MTTSSPADKGGVLVLGASGMLGHALMHELPGALPEMPVMGTVRARDDLPTTFASTHEDRLVEGIDVLDYDTVSTVIADLEPDVVINAIGVIKQAPGVDDAVLTTQINALLPHLLARTCSTRGTRLIQVSTDCVFSGSRGGYAEHDVPDPVDFYGRSKLLGEVPGPHITLRTSIIGHELRRGHSLLEWFLKEDGNRVKGFSRAIYSGLPTTELARVIGEVVIPDPSLTGLWHVASTPISKADLLNIFADEYSWHGQIEPDDTFVCDRSLSAARFEKTSGYVAPTWPDMVRDMRDAQVRWNAT